MERALPTCWRAGTLVSFVLLQFGRTTTRYWRYLWNNFAGAAVLLWVAVVAAPWGFVIVLAVRALAALVGLGRRFRGTTDPVHQKGE